jgi:PAS domain S-box-containing protein
MFGVSEPDLLGTEYMPLVHPDDREATARAVVELADPPHTVYVEQRALTRHGWRWIAWVDTAVLDDAGQISAIIGVGRDVTDRKRLEEQLRQSQKMQAIGQLAGGIAHDFNNILQTIVTNLEFVLDELPTDSPIRGDLLEARASAGRAATLVRQLLTFSRQEPSTPVELDLDATVTEALSMLRRLIGQQIALQFDPGSQGTTTRADPRQVEQVLMNLCVNARDARSNRITLTTDVATFSEADCSSRPWARPGRFVRLSVADDGHGMDQTVLDKLFEPFFTTKDVGEGTGLGLATVYGIVEQHDGLIHVTSEPGAGSLFDIYLPAVETTRSSAPSRASAAAAGVAQETILVADDDAQVRTATQRILQRAGYRVVTARDGLEAVRLATTTDDTLTLAILDLYMPGLSGPEALDQIRELTPSIRVLFSSGGTIEPSVSPPDGLPIVTKPYTHQELLDAVRSALDRPATDTNLG